MDWMVRPRLLATPGVAKVASFGGEVRQLQVQVDPGAAPRLRRRPRRSSPRRRAAPPASAAAACIDGPNQRIVVRSEGQSLTPAAIGQVVVREREGSVLRIDDVARWSVAGAPKFGDGAINGEPAIVTVVSAQLGANTKLVAGDVEAALQSLAPALEREGITLHADVFRPATFIDLALRNITTSLLLGALLVSVILMLFLADLRTAAISLTAIPLSLLSATILLEVLGFSINTLTLGGLAIALGEVVDDAIIDVENIARRLREQGAAVVGDIGEVVVRASLEVRGSVVYATFVVALVFLPVLALTGVQGALFRPLALAYIFATLASLIVALTVTPALSRVLLTRRNTACPRIARCCSISSAATRGCSPPSSGSRWRSSSPRSSLCVGAVATLPFFGATFLPEFREGHYLIHMSAVPGTSLEESVRLGQGRLRPAARPTSACGSWPSAPAAPSSPRTPGAPTTPSSRSTWYRSPAGTRRRCRTTCVARSRAFPGSTSPSAASWRSGSRRRSPARPRRWW